jgi:hypothetical protein
VFDVEVPVLHVTGAQIALNGERGIRQREREERRKRIVSVSGKNRQREEDVVVEERRVEIERFSRRERRLIVVDAIAAAQDSLPASPIGPGKTDARREVVLVRVEAAARHSVRAHRHEVRVFTIKTLRDLQRRPAASCIRNAGRR